VATCRESCQTASTRIRIPVGRAGQAYNYWSTPCPDSASITIHTHTLLLAYTTLLSCDRVHIFSFPFFFSFFLFSFKGKTTAFSFRRGASARVRRKSTPSQVTPTVKRGLFRISLPCRRLKAPGSDILRLKRKRRARPPI
jgi:hypothetical protein